MRGSPIEPTLFIPAKLKKQNLTGEMIESYFPNFNDDRLIDEMLDVISKVWDEQLECCEVCPT